MGRVTEFFDFINSTDYRVPKDRYSHLTITKKQAHARFVYQAKYRPDLLARTKRNIASVKKRIEQAELKIDLSKIIFYGPYKKKTFGEVLKINPAYIVWSFYNRPLVDVPRSVYKAAKLSLEQPSKP